MMFLRILTMLAAVVVAWPAEARHVELIVAQPMPVPSNEASAGSAVAEPVSSEMMTGFESMVAVAAPALPPPGTIPIPWWLRAPRFVGSSPQFFPGCGDPAYRIRSDLGSVVQARRARLYGLVAQAACEAGIPVGLFDALVVQESRYDPAALSPKGAFGLAQLMPDTARGLRVNAFDPLENLRGGARYLRQQLDAFGRVDLALAAYNAGPGRVRARWSVPRFRETLDYVTKVSTGWTMTTSRAVEIVGPQSAWSDTRSRWSRRNAELIQW